MAATNDPRGRRRTRPKPQPAARARPESARAAADVERLPPGGDTREVRERRRERGRVPPMKRSCVRGDGEAHAPQSPRRVRTMLRGMGDFTLRRLDHVSLNVGDRAGLDRVVPRRVRPRAAERAGRDDWPVFMGEFGSCIALFQAETDSLNERESTGLRHVAFAVGSSISSARRRAPARRGIEFRFEDHGNAHSLYVPDPDGNVIELTTTTCEQAVAGDGRAARSGASTGSRHGRTSRSSPPSSSTASRAARRSGTWCPSRSTRPAACTRSTPRTSSAGAGAARGVLGRGARRHRPGRLRTASEPAAPGGRRVLVRRPLVGEGSRAPHGAGRVGGAAEGRTLLVLDAVTGATPSGSTSSSAGEGRRDPQLCALPGRTALRHDVLLEGAVSAQGVGSEVKSRISRAVSSGTSSWGRCATPSSSTQSAWGSQSSR